MQPTKLVASVALTALTCAGGAFADAGHSRTHHDSFYVDARVVDVAPIVRIVRVEEPRRVCWDEEVTNARTRILHSGSYTPMVVGGIVGGVLGNQLVKGKRRKAVTVAGAVLGASIGRDISRHRPLPRTYTTVERRCEIQSTYHEEERVEGYRVTYRYRGRTFTTRMDHRPGPRVRVKVDVQPVAYQRGADSSVDWRSRSHPDCDDDCTTHS